jgi:formylglycine-generating enzyme
LLKCPWGENILGFLKYHEHKSANGFDVSVQHLHKWEDLLRSIQLPPTAALAARGGPVAMGGADPWSIESVLADRVIIAYAGASSPQFVADTYVANLTPVRFTDIFYRKILSASDAPATKKLTLMTVDVPFAEIVEEGTGSLSSQSVSYNIGAGGVIQPAATISFSQVFPRVGINKDGAGPLAFPGNPKFSVTLPEAHVWFTPSLEISFETKGFSLLRASIQARGDVDAAIVPQLNYRPVGAEKDKKIDLHDPISKLTFIGSIGPVPIWVDWTYSTKLDLSFEANAGISLSSGFRRNFSVTAAAQYQKDASPPVTYTKNFTLAPLEEVPLTLSAGGTLKGKVALVPQLDVRLQSLLGYYVNADPRFEVDLTASSSLSFSQTDGRFTIAPGGAATLMGGVFADLNAGLSVIGVDQSYLPAMDPVRLFTRGWDRTWPTSQAITFSTPATPQSLTVPSGGTISLDGLATGGDGPIYYQWLQNGVVIPGQTARQLIYPNAAAGAAAIYTLRARCLVNGSIQSVSSPEFTVNVFPSGPTPAGFALIPGGVFTMGDQSNPKVGYRDETVHTTNVSAFYMGITEVTYAQWQATRTYALANGYTFDNAGQGKAADHPVHRVSWWDIVKWCNARSQQEGLQPCFNVAGVVFKTGQNNAIVCDFTRNGYRLPSEAKWEKAARGGNPGKNFSWGDTITHSQANYNSSGYAYDISPTRGHHPTYGTGNTPYTSPVGSFGDNGYGLKDMTGNVWEWCWDWYGSYPADGGSDYRGPSLGSVRVFRGGAWSDSANSGRVARRFSNTPTNTGSGIGFRLARGTL